MKVARTRAGQQAMTLTEMLVTISVILLLAGLTFPALSAAKEKARAITCRNHLAQLGKAFAMYHSDHRFYPGAGEVAIVTNQLVLPSGESWDDRLKPYVSHVAKVFQCPSHQPVRFGAVDSPAFGYNAYGSGFLETGERLGLGDGRKDSPPVAPHQVQAPANMITLGEMQLANSVLINFIGPNKAYRMGSLETVIADRHRGQAAMLFCDGHVESAPQQSWIANTDPVLSRWNIDNTPHRDVW